MAPIVELDAPGRHDLDNAIAYLEEQRAGAGLALLDAFWHACALLLEFPGMGRRLHGRYRKFVMADLPYTVIYTIERFGILVIALAHHSQRPNFWRKRLRDRNVSE